MAVLILLLVLYLLFIEVRQGYKDGLDYFKSLYNYIDLMQYLGTVYVVVSNMIGYDESSMLIKRDLCAFVLICQGVKMIVDWLRLFDNTSFYVTLIIRTFVDVAYFLLILLILLIYAGNAMYMLDLSKDTK